MERLKIVGFLLMCAMPTAAHAFSVGDLDVSRLFMGPCYGEKRDPDQPLFNYQQNANGQWVPTSKRGFVAVGSDVNPNAVIDEGAQVCSGVTISDATVHIGPHANLRGAIMISDTAFVDSIVRGCGAAIGGYSRVETDRVIYSRPYGCDHTGVTIMNSHVYGNAIVADRTDLEHAAVGGNAHLDGHSEACHVTITTGHYSDKAEGENCDGVVLASAGTERGGARGVWNTAQYRYPLTEAYYASGCPRQWVNDPQQGWWSCAQSVPNLADGWQTAGDHYVKRVSGGWLTYYPPAGGLPPPRQRYEDGYQQSNSDSGTADGDVMVPIRYGS